MATGVKGYVRKSVWLPVVKERFNRMKRPIRYFTLTTADLYDVKLFEREGLIEKTERGYPGLGFCEFVDTQHVEINRKLGWCFWSYKGRFEDMVFTTPDFDTQFCFDVINLDFISVPFPHEEAPLDGTWGAIQAVLNAQWKNRTGFDIFLTFRGKSDETSEVALDKVADLLKSNLVAGRGSSEFEQRVGHDSPKRLLSEDYVEFLCLGIPKLLIADALELEFQMTRADAYLYPRDGSKGSYYIVTFAFSFEIPTSPQRGFADPPLMVSSYDEAVPMIFRKQAVDVSKILDSDTDLLEELTED